MPLDNYARKESRRDRLKKSMRATFRKLFRSLYAAAIKLRKAISRLLEVSLHFLVEYSCSSLDRGQFRRSRISLWLYQFFNNVFSLFGKRSNAQKPADFREEEFYRRGFSLFDSGQFIQAESAFHLHLVISRQTDVYAVRRTNDCPNPSRYADFERQFRRFLGERLSAWQERRLAPPEYLTEAGQNPIDPSVGARLKFIFAFPQFIHNSDRYVECDLKDHLYESAVNAGIDADYFFADRIAYPVFERYPELAKQDLAELRERIRTERPDVFVFAANFKGDEFSINQEYLHELKESFGVKIVAFMEDAWGEHAVPYANYWGPVADLIVHFAPGGSVEHDLPFAAKTLRVPYPVNSHNFFPDPIKTYDISFFGTFYAYLRPFWLMKAEKAADRLRMRHNIRPHHRSSDCPSIAEYATILRRSRMVLNFSSRDGRSRPITGRAWQTMQCGTLLLQEESPATAHYFVPFVHYIPFDNVRELQHFMEFFKKNDDYARRICDNAAAFSRQYYSEAAIWGRIVGHLSSVDSPAHTPATMRQNEAPSR
ncbi:MAG: hypothetical protein JWL84_5558 [Rhodospirillales bacterium]|nr:hypothetical protein [Rhodospirillales bacterium]